MPRDYRCGVCGSTDPMRYMRCYHPGCPDGRDQPFDLPVSVRDPDFEIDPDGGPYLLSLTVAVIFSFAAGFGLCWLLKGWIG